MIRKYLSILALATAALVPSAASATGWTSFYYVGLIQIASDGGFYIQLVDSAGTLQALCGVAANGYQNTGIVSTTAGDTSDGVKAMLATATAAKLSGRKVKFWANDPSASNLNCNITMLQLAQ